MDNRDDDDDDDFRGHASCDNLWRSSARNSDTEGR